MPSPTAPLLRALAGDRPEHTPVWFMRQAGRSLPEYRELRVGTRMLDACLTPELAAEITLQPVRRHADVDRITAIDPEDLDHAAITDAVRIVIDELGETPLIGFAGAPFTLAAYLIEGGPSKEHLRARAMMHADPESWNRLADWLSRVSRRFLQAQRDAGASALQLFDSWAGSLNPADYRQHIAPHSKAAVVDLGVPVIHFGVGTGPFLTDMRLEGIASAVGVDWRQPLDEAASILGPDVTVQGNIDPAMLQAPWEVLEAHVLDVLARGRAARAHIVNLGHGVPPETDPDQLTRIVELVHRTAS